MGRVLGRASVRGATLKQTSPAPKRRGEIRCQISGRSVVRRRGTCASRGRSGSRTDDGGTVVRHDAHFETLSNSSAAPPARAASTAHQCTARHGLCSKRIDRARLKQFILPEGSAVSHCDRALPATRTSRRVERGTRARVLRFTPQSRHRHDRPWSSTTSWSSSSRRRRGRSSPTSCGGRAPACSTRAASSPTSPPSARGRSPTSSSHRERNTSTCVSRIDPPPAAGPHGARRGVARAFPATTIRRPPFSSSAKPNKQTRVLTPCPVRPVFTGALCADVIQHHAHAD